MNVRKRVRKDNRLSSLRLVFEKGEERRERGADAFERHPLGAGLAEKEIVRSGMADATIAALRFVLKNPGEGEKMREGREQA